MGFRDPEGVFSLGWIIGRKFDQPAPMKNKQEPKNL
jgi:hypothetical protein